MAVGNGELPSGKKVQMIVKPKDVVICSRYGGSEVKIDEDEYTIVSQSDILAIVEE